MVYGALTHEGRESTELSTLICIRSRLANNICLKARCTSNEFSAPSGLSLKTNTTIKQICSVVRILAQGEGRKEKVCWPVRGRLCELRIGWIDLVIRFASSVQR